EQIVDTVLGLPPDTRVVILAPMVRGRKGEARNVLDDARRNGFVRVRVDGQIYDLGEEIAMDKNRKHDVEIVVDRLVIHDQADQGEEAREDGARLADSVETALKLGSGLVIISEVDGEDHLYSEHFACVVCGISVGEIEPRTFSFNNPHGACPSCTGLGSRLEFDPDLVVPNPHLSLDEGAIQPWSKTSGTYYWSLLNAFCKQQGITTHRPWETLTEDQRQLILTGPGDQTKVRISHHTKSGRHYEFDGRFEGVIPLLARRYRESESDTYKQECEEYMTSVPCTVCNGARLKPEALAVTVGKLNIVEVSQHSIYEATRWFAMLV